MTIRRSVGTTDSERLLAKLCEETFLGFWSYANPFREQGGPKELCDLLVVCGNHVILFSDKSCVFPDTGNVQRDWSRWYRRAVKASAKQVLGAERWIKQHPNRIFIDHKCTQPLPISLPEPAKCQFHRVIVALGATARCKREFGGSGSLQVTPSIVANAHHDARNFDVQPFHIGTVEADVQHLHVFDDFTLPLLLKELDTVADFVAYLEFKETLLSSGKVGTIAGEENLLAMFLSNFVQTGDWSDLLIQATDDAVLDISSTAWQVYASSQPYRERREAFQHCYVWDKIIGEFATHSFGGTLIKGSPLTVADNETMFRYMASEPRLARAFLSATMLQRWSQYEENRVDYRIVQSPTHADMLYVFVFVPNTCETESEYRELRQGYLTSYCSLVARKQEKHDLVLGIATQAGDEPYRTFDVFALQNGHWTPEMESIVNEIELDLEVSGEGPIHHLERGDSQSQTEPNSQNPNGRRRGKLRPKSRRNDKCPCGSGKKYKKCCLRR